jgi:capsular exopolysaccharide synthesis family protein
VSPKANVIWTIAVVLGLAIPLLIFRIKNIFYNKVGDISQVEASANLPLIGVISHIKGSNGPFVIDSHSRSVVSEQLRHLRSSISVALKGKPIRTILVASFQPSDGKSFVSLNLAASFALLKKKTIMLEFDLRKPHVARDLGFSSNEGISTILEGNSKLADLVVKVDNYNDYLYILPAGDKSSSPAELISGPLMPALMKQILEVYDYVIINSPPVGVVTDANLLQRYADITLMVIRQDHTSVNVYHELKTRSALHNESPVFIVLNDVGRRKIYRGDGYGSYVYQMGKGYYTN